MARLEIRLLGPLQVKLDGKPLTGMRSDKVRGLLAYLCVEADKPHRREKLAGLLWPDYPEASARGSLRRALADLRQATGDEEADPPYLEITPQTIQLNRGSDTWIDATVFDKLTKKIRPADEQTLDGWAEAVELYQGEFMEGFSLADSPAFEEWILLNQERYQRLALETLQRLADSHEGSGEYDRALDYARRQLELDPTWESAHRQVMRSLALSGQREAAIAQFEACTRALASQLGVEPSAETVGLYQALRSGEPPASARAKPPFSIQQPRMIGECPYRGLSAFREQDAALFFGREDFTRQLLEAIQSQHAATVILGPSGSGKSSVAHAGLIPRLREKGDWLVADLRPGASPFHSLAAALLTLLEPTLSETDRLVESQKLAVALSQGDLPLQRLVERVLDKSDPGTNLLLLIDQFEELYTLCQQPETRRRFLDELLETAEATRERGGGMFALVVTMRADFMGQALDYRPFADILQNNLLMMGPMTREEMCRAIEQPAIVQGAAFEGGLVERILDDVGEQPGYLPLLEFALTLLWERADSGWLTHSSYESTGEVKGALAQYADLIYSRLDKDEKEKARRVFLQVVRPGEGTQDTRRVATRAEIGETSWPLAQHLADKRLVVSGRDVSVADSVEEIHEALIAGWGRLRDWIDVDRAFRTWQERLRGALQQWNASGRDEGALLRGAPLAEAEGWQAERGSDLTPAEQEYIQAGGALRERQREESERTRRRIVLGLSAGLVITLILAFLAVLQWRSAQRAQALAEAERDLTRKGLSRLLASQAQILVDDELDLASLLSIEAVNIDPSIEARSSLLAALTAKPQLVNILHGHEDDVLTVAFSPDGHRLAAGDAAGDIILWETSEKGETPLPGAGRPLNGHTERVTSLVFSPDGRLLASGGFDDRIIIWDVASGKMTARPLSGHTDNVWSLAFSPDGKTLASAGADGQVLLWDTGSISKSSDQPGVLSLATGLGTVASLAISPDGRLLAGGLGNGSVMLWDLETSAPAGEPLKGHDRFIRALAFNPEGEMLASGGDDKQIILWDMRQDATTFGQPIGEPWTDHSDWITDLTFNPVEPILISTGKDGLAISWDLSHFSTNKRAPSPQMLIEGDDPLWSLAVAPNGRRLITNGKGSDAILIDLGSIHPLARALSSHLTEVGALAFSPDRQVLAATDWDGRLSLWDAASGASLHAPIEADPITIVGLAFSPDGNTLATAGGDTLIHLWDVKPGSKTFGEALDILLRGHTDDITAVAYHPQRPILVSGAHDNTIIFWDVDPSSRTYGEPLAEFQTDFVGGIWNLVFNAKGDQLAAQAISEAMVWDTSTLPPQAGLPVKIPGSPLSVFTNAMTIDPGTYLMARVSENTIQFIDLVPGSPSFGSPLPGLLEGREGRINAVNISPDSQMLASGDRYGRLQLWDITTRQTIGPIIPGADSILDLYFSQDGNSLASGSTDGSIVIWNMNLEAWKALACQRTNRNLSEEEWRRYFGEEPYRETC